MEFLAYVVLGLCTVQPAAPAPDPVPPLPLIPAAAPPVMPETSAAPTRPAPGQVIRAGGLMDAQVVEQDGTFTFERCAITTPLPEGYPPPTPPGAIDLKSYPSVRRAQVTAKTNADLGMNMGFFPLFNHIKRRDIAMTSPVEMDYQGWFRKPDRGDGPDQWTMSFLYRRPQQGDTGADPADQQVQIIDTEPTLVVSVGMRGAYGLARVRLGLDLIDTWLSANPQWQAAGDARSLSYNGPDTRNRDKWSEVQLPIKPAEPTPNAPQPAGSPTQPIPEQPARPPAGP